ncbi:SurA N-terminal domain-containing protein [Microvirga sp. W0021]|uniref:Parvulin-like PPIase n=1 Tax=Hohaiivirga grylli TaxID=3133970 RepID=A0ABV0BIN6_9HYPH
MLEGLRKAQQNWLGKIIISFLFGILIISFAMVFVTPYLQTTAPDTVVKAGKRTVSFAEYQTAFNQQQRVLQERLGKQLSPTEARAMQLDRQVLSQLASQAVLDETGRVMGLAISDDMVRQAIYSIPAFQQTNGFNAEAFKRYLDTANMTESGFIQNFRSELMRNQIISTLSSGLTMPEAMQQLSFRLFHEKRNVSYYVLNNAAAGEIPAPTNEQLQTAYDANKAQFRAPEYRSFDAIAVLPDTLPSLAPVTDEDVRKAYEASKTTQSADAEYRTIQQIIFADADEAKDAQDRLNSGKATFDSLAKEKNIAPEALSIGSLQKSDIFDPKVADAAFSLEKGKVSAVVDGSLGPAILRVTDIKTGFDAVKDKIKTNLVRSRAENQISDMRDFIEDATAMGRSLPDVAKEKNLQLIQIKAVDKAGLDTDGKQVEGLPDASRLIQAVFASDIGVDNTALSTDNGGYIWYHVTNVIASRDRTLDEIRPQITDIWKQGEIDTRLSKIADEQLANIKSVDDLKKQAATIKAEVKSAQDLVRTSTAPADIGANGLRQIFATPVNKATFVTGPNGKVIFVVTAATVPEFKKFDQDVEQLSNQLSVGLGDDLLVEFINRAQKEIGVVVNQNVADRLFGGNGE